MANLRSAAAELGKAGLQLLIEPINNHDSPDFWLNRTDRAVSVLHEVGAANAFVHYDIHHAQRYKGELAVTMTKYPMTKYLPRVGHILLADNPGHREPGTGKIDFTCLFKHRNRIGYTGWTGCEYKPATTTEAGLGWRQQLAQ